MKRLSTTIFRGPSIYALFPVILQKIDLESAEEWPTCRLGALFIEKLVHLLPGLVEHGCSYEARGGFIRRMEEGTWLGHVFEHLAIELQNMAGIKVSFGKTRSNGEVGIYDVVYEYQDEQVGIEAGELAFDLLHHLLPQELQPKEDEVSEFNFLERCDGFIRYCQTRTLGPSTASLVKAAEERSIPWIRLNGENLIQLGHGLYQKRMEATITGNTSHLAVELASNKEATNQLLASLGLPVPELRAVTRLQSAYRAAMAIGYPLVVKPLDGNHGRGVTVDVRTKEQLRVAYEKALLHSEEVVIEQYIEGFDYRLLVIGGKLVAASQRIPGRIIGDGEKTIRELVDLVNLDPRRGVGHENVLTRLEIDEEADRLLNLKGYNHHSIPQRGEIVYLRSTANLSTGGTAIDVTDTIHPDNRKMAERAVSALGLDIGGVDFLTKDIARSYHEIGGGICEINAAPGFRMHISPTVGTPRDVAASVMEMLFPNGHSGRIPIAAITGTNGKTTTSRMVAHILHLSGKKVGLASTDGVYIDGKMTWKGDMTGPVSARMVLGDPSIDAAVLETARGGIVRSGLGYLASNVSACLNVTSDHLGMGGVETVEELAAVKRVVIEVATDVAVLNADDPLCLAMADYSKAKKLCYVTMNHNHALVKEHVKMGGLAVVLEKGIHGDMIAVYDGKGHHTPLLWSHLIPATLEGRAIHNVQNAMFAIALAHGLGVALPLIAEALKTFHTTFLQAPGRLNIYDSFPFKVIMDYAHNPAGVKIISDLVSRLDCSGQRIIVMSIPGDRRDEDVQACAEAMAGRFDHYICRSDDDLRGREQGEIPRILADTLLQHGVQQEQIQIIEREEEANLAALKMAKKGDLILMLVEMVDRSWRQIISFHPEEEMATAVCPAKADVAYNIEPPKNYAAYAAGCDETLELIRDSRGVRIARGRED